MNSPKIIRQVLALMLALVCAGVATAAPNLIPYQPVNWSDKIVVSTTAGTSTDSTTLSATDTLYVDWAVLNNGDTSTGMGFYTYLYVDGILKNYWAVSALSPSYYHPQSDYYLGSLSAGTHTLTITNDVFGGIAESNEGDNGYTKTIVVNPPSYPNLTPYQPAGWSDKIVVSTVTGTTTNSPYYTATDTLYLDWAVINDGTAGTAARFHTYLYVDGIQRTSWYTDPPLAASSYTGAPDYSLGSLSRGVHMLMIITDAMGAITESNESDNSYYVQITVGDPPQPNLAPYKPSDWSDKVVVATNAGAIADNALTTASSVYVSWAVGNIGGAPATNGFLTTLSVDGDVVNTWSNPPPLAASGCVSNIGYVVGVLSAGPHTITLATDTGSAVTESNEGDNSYIKPIAVLQAPPTVETLPATAISDVSAQLNAAIDPHRGGGYAWFEYGTNASYGKTAAFQYFDADAANLSATLSGLSPETIYHYRMVAYNAGGTNHGGDVSFTTGGPDIRIEPLSLTFTSSASPSGLAAATQPLRQSELSAANQARALSAGEKLLHASDVLGGFAHSPTVKVTVNLALPSNASLRADFSSPAAVKALRAGVKAAQQEVLDSLPADQVKPRFRFDNVAAFSAEVTPQGLSALQNHPRVASIEPVYVVEPHLAQGIPLIHGLTYRSAYNGAGIAIAICDTGVDYNHPRLGGGGFPNSKVIGGYDVGDDDADPLPSNHAHGTCCAGIAAGDLGTVGDYIGGVAYNAKIYALKITSGSQGSSSTDAEAAAWDWCVTHQYDNTNYPIMVISMSFGGGRYFSPCDTELPSMTAIANNAIAAGITILVSSGNDGYCDSIAFPSCISSVISVGAVYDAAYGHAYPCVNANSCAPKSASSGCSSGYVADDVTAADKVTSYANMADFITLLAPGNECYAPDIVGSDGYSSGDYDTSFGGTSAACPYAAGAVACLQSAAKARTGSFLSPAEVRNRLLTYGDNITDTKVAITKPRVNLERAIEGLADFSQAFRIYNDGVGTLTVNAVAAETPAEWIGFAPAGPFVIPALGYQDVSVIVNMDQAPAGNSSIRLLVASSDADKSPYPGGVYVQTIRQTLPVLSDMVLSNDMFQFVVNGPAGTSCVVQASSNLADWWSLSTNPIPGEGSLLVTDPGAASHNRRFYRALLQ
ncbi:MAG TPA: S8 family serine peptidase [Candidatus Paceibacterota bacterium]|nr:S8 family serine peptidase [Verrucomicrobiota bacterium]HSA12759.1 S8 family serine peptidase [Candidatus Paceibacterota bacterium]